MYCIAIDSTSLRQMWSAHWPTGRIASHCARGARRRRRGNGAAGCSPRACGTMDSGHGRPPEVRVSQLHAIWCVRMRTTRMGEPQSGNYAALTCTSILRGRTISGNSSSDIIYCMTRTPNHEAETHAPIGMRRGHTSDHRAPRTDCLGAFVP